jgi:hypothetical protein
MLHALQDCRRRRRPGLTHAFLNKLVFTLRSTHPTTYPTRYSRQIVTKQLHIELFYPERRCCCFWQGRRPSKQTYEIQPPLAPKNEFE